MAEPFTDAELEALHDLYRKDFQAATIPRLLATVDALKRDFQCVEDHTEHWQIRAEAAEAERNKLRDVLEGRENEIIELEAERDRLREALKAYDRWASRMPDAGFTSNSPHWSWWHKRPFDQARAALGEES